MEYKLLKDLSSVCGVKEYNLQGLSELAIDLIGHYIHCAKLEKDNPINIDIGIGNLAILCKEDCIEYKFSPSEDMEKSLSRSARMSSDVLIDRACELIGQRINKTYKELI